MAGAPIIGKWPLLRISNKVAARKFHCLLSSLWCAVRPPSVLPTDHVSGRLAVQECFLRTKVNRRNVGRRAPARCKLHCFRLKFAQAMRMFLVPEEPRSGALNAKHIQDHHDQGKAFVNAAAIPSGFRRIIAQCVFDRTSPAAWLHDTADGALLSVDAAASGNAMVRVPWNEPAHRKVLDSVHRA